MKKIIILSIWLMLLSVITVIPVSALNDSDNASPVIYPTGYIDPEIVIPVSSYPYNDYQFESGYGRAVSTENLPVSYDLRDYNRVSPLRDQAPYGSCWAFGTLGSVESNLLIDDAVKYAGIDLSERHLAYFSNHREEISCITNPLPRLEGLKGDFAYMKPQENYLNNGGNYLMTTFTLMSWIGAVNESDAVYITSGVMPPLDASTAYDNDTVHVENVYWISMNDKNAVKAMIREYGGAFVAFNVNQTNPDYVKSLTENTVAYYQTAEIRTNHVVTLIGWDDNFAKEKFNTTPDGNGAWLVKNSWGEGPYSYAWISYYDTSISSSTSVACFFDAVDAAKYDNNYQYDGGWGGNCRSYTNTIAPRFISNVFTADSAETLKAVAFMTDQTDITYSVQIYLSPSDSSNPESGTPAFNEPQAGFNQYAGYVTIPLTQSVSLSAGQKFAVVINLSHQTEPVHIWIDTSADTTGRYISTYAEAGQSFIRGVNNDWTDVSADGKTNVRIKAFTNEVFDGDGSADNPYLIANEEQLTNLAEFVNSGIGNYASAHYELSDNITLTSDWTPIGKSSSKFRGTFDGASHKISNLRISAPSSSSNDHYGLFGITKDAEISNLTISVRNISGNYNLGGLVGYNEGGSITNCFVTGNVSGAGYYVGGIAGSNSGNITNSYTAVNINGMMYVGGLVGYNTGSITNSYASVNVTGEGSVGGLIGQNSGSITNCYANGVVNCTYGKSGGLVGCNYASGCTASITNCYAVSQVKGEYNVGGLVGENSAYDGSTASITNSVALNPFVNAKYDSIFRIAGSNSGNIINCYAWDNITDRNGGAFTGSTINGTGASSVMVWANSSFYESIGFDFTNNWKMNSGNSDYQLPVLQWQTTPVLLNASYLRPILPVVQTINTTNESSPNKWNAVNPAAIGYQLSPVESSIELIEAPEITRGGLTVKLDRVNVTKTVNGVEIKIDAAVNPDGSITVTGDYSDAESLTVTFIGRKIGDTRGNGDPVSILNALDIAEHVVSIAPLDNNGLFYGNIDGIGEIDILDALSIAQYVVGILDENYE